MTKIKGVIFDMDNTLIRSRIDFGAMKQETFEFLVSRALLSHPINLADHTTSTLIEEASQSTSMTDALLAEIWEIPKKYEKMGMRNADLERGVNEVLECLRGKFTLVILTNNTVEAALAALEENGIRHYFDSVVGREMVKSVKPSPDGLYAIMDAYKHISAEEWISVGDSWIDGKASMNAGIKFVAYNGDARKMHAMGVSPVADIRDLRELRNHLN